MKLGIYGDRTPPLGRLERGILDSLWRRQGQSALDIYAELSTQRGITLSTVQTTLERLTRKRLLRRSKQGRSFRYHTAISRDALTARMVSDLVEALSTDDLNGAILGLLDQRDTIDEATLDRLERWIEDRRNPQRSRK